jgi:hypothetical protein
MDKKGAQEFPFGVVIIKNETITATLSESNILYRGGPLDNQLIGFRTR